MGTHPIFESDFDCLTAKMVSSNSLITSVETGHEDQIHDVQFDFYGTRMATASSDKSIKIFEVNGEQTHKIQEIKDAHDGAVWQISWAHPKYGSVLASAGFDKKVILHREKEDGSWQKVYTHAVHNTSVNTVQFGPCEYGLVAACGSSDGDISILTNDNPKNLES